MSAFEMHKSPRCQHIHYSGRACKAPARRGRNYCVFHQAAHLDAGGCVLPIVEDLHSYQIAVIRIMQSLAADARDSKKATALLYALQLLGGKLSDFVKQREQVENPARALYNEVSERYEARKHPFPSFISDTDLCAILKDIAREHQAEQNNGSNDNIESVPQAEGVPPRNPASSAVISVAPCSSVSSVVKKEVATDQASRSPDGGIIDRLEACDVPGAAPRPPDTALAGFAHDDLVLAEEELGGAVLRAANDRDQPRDLAPRDEPQRPARRARQHGPVGIVGFPDFARVLQHEHRAGDHVFRHPLAQDIQFSDHSTLHGS